MIVSRNMRTEGEDQWNIETVNRRVSNEVGKYWGIQQFAYKNRKCGKTWWTVTIANENPTQVKDIIIKEEEVDVCYANYIEFILITWEF